MLKLASKFAMDIFPSVIATILGAYIVNHYINAKPPAADAAANPLDQAGQQALDNNAYAQFMEPTNYNQGILQNYMQDINGSYGSSSSTEATLPPNLFGTALGGAATGVGLYNMFSTGASPNAGAFNMGSGNYVTTGLGDGTSYVDNGFF